MTTSRRNFLRLGAVSAGAAVSWPLERGVWARAVEPSRFGADDGLIRLYSNENAYGPSAKVLEAVQSAAASVNRYPRMQYSSLVEHIAAAHHVSSNCVLLGCGSTEILRMAACAFLGAGRQLIQAAPTFEAIEHYATAAGAEVASVHLTPAFAHDLEAMRARFGPSTALVYICNPNNPTASLTARKDLEIFIARLPASAFVVIDEAYHHYAGTSEAYASFIDRPFADERVIVTRTFSKVYGLAGLRLGYAVASPKVIERLRQFSTHDNVNSVITQAAGAALDDKEGTNDFVQRNLDDRQEFFNQAMARMIKPIDSHANFVMMNILHPAEGAIEHFRKNNILIGRHFPPLDTYIRVSLGRPDEMEAFWRTWDLLPYAKDFMDH